MEEEDINSLASIEAELESVETMQERYNTLLESEAFLELPEIERMMIDAQCEHIRQMRAILQQRAATARARPE